MSDIPDNPDLNPQQLWYNWGGVAPSVSSTITGDTSGGTAITTITVDTGISVTGPIVRLTGGVSGFSFVGSAPATITLLSALTTKGDLYVRTSSAGTRLAVGSDGQILVADSAQATGVKWAAASSVVSSWIPLVDGSEPPNFITDGAGVLILVAYP